MTKDKEYQQNIHSRLRDRWLLAVVILLFWMSTYLYVPIFPVYVSDIGTSLRVTGFIIATYGFSQLILRIPIGLISDHFGRRKPFLWFGLLMSLVSGTGLALSNSPVLLGLFRALSGVSAATWVVGIVLYMNLFPPEKSVKVAGLASFLAAGGQLIAGASGGALAQALGPRVTFWGSVGLAGMGMLLFLPVSEKRITSGRPYNINLIMSTIRSPVILTASIAAGIVQFAGYSTTYSFTPIYADQMGSTSLQLGWLTSAMLLSYALSAGLLGLFITSRVEKWTVLIGLLAISAATIGQILSRSVGQLILTRVLHGVGHGFSLSVLMGFSVKHVSSEDRALVMGVFQSIYAAGIFAGPAFTGLLAQRLGIESTFLIVGAIVLAAIPLVLWGFQQQPQREALVVS